MHSFILNILTLATLTAAVPHVGHSHRHIHLRPRVQSNIGQCGGELGFTCGPGYCCSEWGYCGNTEEYCGAGCNPKWGTCDSNSTVSATATESAYSTVTLAVSSTPEALTAYSSEVTSTTSADISVVVNTKIHSRPAWTGHSSWVSSAQSTSSVEQPSPSEAAPSSTSVPAETSSAIESSSAAPSTTLATSYAPVPSSYSAPAPSSALETSTWSAPASTTSSQPAATPSSSGGSSGSDSYKLYTGDGSTSAGWPSQDSWVSFDSMWSANMAYISISCAQFGQADNSESESEELKDAIQSIASSSGVDERFILAVVMQESKGCVRAPTTNYGVTNPGLMQSHDGTGSCNNGNVQDPCPSDEIDQMIKDGTTGTSSGDGLEQLISQCGSTDVSKYYKAARMYNSGSVASSGNLEDGIATHCYASDIANRLTGWVKAATACNL